MIDTKKPYYIAESDDDDDYSFKLLKGPNGIEFFLGEPEDCNWLRDGRDIMDKLNWYEEQLRATTPLTREELETVLRQEGFTYLDVESFGSHEWESRTLQYHEYRGVTIINEPDGSISISATYERGVSNPLRKVFRMPPTRATLRSCGVVK